MARAKFSAFGQRALVADGLVRGRRPGRSARIRGRSRRWARKSFQSRVSCRIVRPFSVHRPSGDRPRRSGRRRAGRSAAALASRGNRYSASAKNSGATGRSGRLSASPASGAQASRRSAASAVRARYPPVPIDPLDPPQVLAPLDEEAALRRVDLGHDAGVAQGRGPDAGRGHQPVAGLLLGVCRAAPRFARDLADVGLEFLGAPAGGGLGGIRGTSARIPRGRRPITRSPRSPSTDRLRKGS